MPYSKYTRPPGPFPRVEQMGRPDFHFSNYQRQSLAELLPRKFRELSDPEVGTQDRSLADRLVALTEHRIGLYQSIMQATKGGVELTPARERAAIRRLLEALRPFSEGWVSEQSAELIPSELHDALMERDRQLKGLRVASSRRQPLIVLLGTLGVILKEYAKANKIKLNSAGALNFVSQALTCAHIKHPDPIEHPNRLAALVFPSKKRAAVRTPRQKKG